MRNGTTLLGTFKPRRGGPGAGGWVTKLALGPDGSKLIGTDTSNGYSAGPGTSIIWDKLLKPGINCTASDVNVFYDPDGYAPSPWGQPGCYDVAIAPSDATVQYAVLTGRVWVKKSSGVGWTVCALPSKADCAPNDGNRMVGKHLAVDPQNPSVCFFASGVGLFYTTDKGDTWSTVSTGTLPAPTGTTGNGYRKRSCIAFDPSSSVTSTRKQGLYCFVNGSGLWHSTDAGVNWSKITDKPTSPTDACHMKIAANGYVFLAGTNNGGTALQLSRWNGSAWLEPAGISCKVMAISPHNAGHIYIAGPGGGLGLSKDYGVTWELSGYIMANARVAPNIPWQSFTIEDYMSNGDMEFDPSTNRLWVVEGIGVWYMNSPPTTISGFSQVATWTECSRGIENMVTLNMAFSPQGDLGYACGDRCAFILTKAQLTAGTYLSKHPTIGNAIQNGDGIDWAAEDYNFWALATSYVGSAVFTTDLGQNYTARQTLAGQPGANGIGGNIAVLSKDQWILTETNGGLIWRTADRGATWTRCIVGPDDVNVSASGNTFNYQLWHFTYFTCRRVLMKDRYTTGRCYAYNVSNGEGVPTGWDNTKYLANRGIWRTDDYGATWTRVNSGHIIGYGADDYSGKLTQYGTNSWLWCGGDNALGLWKSTDGMATWSKVTGTDDVYGAVEFGEVWGVGVAKGASSGTLPAVLACGYRQAVPVDSAIAKDASAYGFWISLDGMVTWKRVAQYLDGCFDCVADIVGDPTTFARFAVGYIGSGFQVVDYSYLQRWT